MKDNNARMTGYTSMMKTALLTSGFEAFAFYLAATHMTQFGWVAWIGFALELTWFVTSTLVYVFSSAALLVLSQEEKNGGNKVNKALS